MAEILLAGDICSRVQTEIQRFVEPFEWLIPGWCQKLYIHMFDKDNDPKLNVVIRTGATYEYRFATMTFYTPWLNCGDDREKQLHVIHDLLHISNTPYINFTEDAIQNAYPGEQHSQLRGYLFEQSRVLLESMTQDLAWSIYNRVLREEKTDGKERV